MAQSNGIVVTRISPGSAFRVALALSLVGLLAWILTVIILYVGLEAAGVWTKLNSVLSGVGGTEVFSFGIVIAAAVLIGAAVALATTLLAPLLAVIYNSSVRLFGGLTVSLQSTY